MPGVLLNQGETIALEALVNKTPPQTLVLKLFTSNTTPAEGDTEATYIEAAGFGYAPVSVTPASWTTTAGAPSDVTYPEVTFTFTGIGVSQVGLSPLGAAAVAGYGRVSLFGYEY
ncbi:MAG TPA: hypothetical protein VNJ03_09575 [Vicinamibacterales bacterium]|nr:hypothetical protein [Vicinamibacterales bacterium]